MVVIPPPIRLYEGSMRLLPALVAALLTGCMRHPPQQPTWEEEDKSIRFPKHLDRSVVQVGGEEHLYIMDGETLRAINVAASDFIRPSSKREECWETREAHRFQVVRQGDIIFVEVYLDADYCDMPFMFLDYGVKYAISTDGRILRRLYEGEPEDLSSPPTEDEGERGPEYWVDPSQVGSTIGGKTDCDFLRMLARHSRRKSSAPLPKECEQVDGGAPPAPSQADGGSPPTPPQVDGGSPSVGQGAP